MRSALIGIMCLVALSAAGEDTTSVPAIIRPAVVKLKPQPVFDRNEVALDAAVVGYRALDFVTTRKGLALGCREVVLPQSIAASAWKLAAVEGLAAGAEVAGAAYLNAHGHRTWGHALHYVSISVGAGFVFNNVHAIQTAESNRTKLIKE